jgi:hypothetical protein
MARNCLAALGLALLASTGAALAEESDSPPRRAALAAGDSLGLALFPDAGVEAVASETPETKVEIAATATAPAAKQK